MSNESQSEIQAFIDAWYAAETLVQNEGSRAVIESVNPSEPCHCFDDLLGRTLRHVQQTSNGDGYDAILFILDDGTQYGLSHYQDCCENVSIEDIVGDLDDLIGSPLTMAEEVTEDDPEAGEVGMWTFYKLATVKGYVTIRWYGSSNGYYSISVDFEQIA